MPDHVLSVRGAKIVDGSGQPVILRGYNIGGWMNMENFLTGYPGTESQHRRVLRRVLGAELYDAFFEERRLIPDGHLHEMCFAELEKDPMGEMRKLYEALGLPEFGTVEPTLRTYLESLSSYRKNEFPELASDVRRRIAGEWGRCFEEWGYPV